MDAAKICFNGTGLDLSELVKKGCKIRNRGEKSWETGACSENGKF